MNQSLMTTMSLRDLMVMPEVSPYHFPPWGEEKFRAILEEYFDFNELRVLARRPGAPMLRIGAVEVLSGHFELFAGEDLSVEVLLASAAIPELFRAITVPGRGVFWDGLFSQNPPVHDLINYQVDEIWIIQINSSTCTRVPTETHEILDRRNALSGNLSLEQELAFIDMLNRAITAGRLNDPNIHPIRVSRISLDRELGYRSKLDRRSELLEELREYGRTKCRWFLKDRESSGRAVFVMREQQHAT
jgi:NTE family protein